VIIRKNGSTKPLPPRANDGATPSLPLETDGEHRASDELRPRRMLSIAQLLEIVPVSRSNVNRMVKARRFPKQTYISPNRMVWFEDEIIAWQNSVDAFNPDRGRGKGRRRRRPAST
jgi:prophage regulatory protein